LAGTEEAIINEMRIYLSIIFMGLYTLSFGQSREERELAKQVDKSISENYTAFAPGCAVLVAKNGKVLLEKGYGSANLELKVPMRAEMVFRIGSVTKQFTAIAILQLVDNGQVALTDSIQKFIKDFHFKERTITVENLLTHTSGIRGYEQIDARIPNAIRIDFSPKTVIDSLNHLSLEFYPGTKYAYSNSNYFLLSYIIEQVSGKSYQQYLTENIFQPAGLTSTYYESSTDLIPNRVSGYSFSEGRYWNPDFISMSLVYGAGALRSTVSDLYKWHKALYGGILVKKETFSKAIQPYRLADGKQIEYGYGFFNKTENGIRSIGHGGAIDGFRAIEMYYPDKDVFIAFLCNSDQDNFELLYQKVANIVLGVKSENEFKEVKVSREILNGYVGTYKNNQHSQSMTIQMGGDGRLYCTLSNGTGTNMVLFAQDETLFLLPEVRRIRTTLQFVVENGKTTKLIWAQENTGEFIRVD
jgi:CubicO group peptidase (beta-lactamase class C family)